MNGTGVGKPAVSIVIPTLGRESVLVETVGALLGLQAPAEEILVVDQTPKHDDRTEADLGQWSAGGRIRWLRLGRASIPHAMNTGLNEAAHEVVLFLDDDIVPGEGLVEAHRCAYADPQVSAATGMVLQPGQSPTARDQTADRGKGLRRDLGFPFNSTRRTDIWNVMAGNLSVRRHLALALGGFDERFIGVAYRFETEFCRRLWRHGGRVVFEPAAVVHHLKAPAGGTRTWGFHKTSARGEHAVGDYYFALLESRGVEAWSYMGYRLLTECFSRFHRRRPWYVPVKMLGELRGYEMARRLIHQRRLAAAAGNESE